MNPEAEFVDRLLELEEALVCGRAPEMDNSALPTVSRAEFDRDLGMLRKLDNLRRLHSAVAEPATTGQVQPGGRFGRFLVRRLVGRGGFAAVFVAFDPLLGREVALKIPHPEALVTPELRERFRFEAQATAAFDHPNLATVFEAGEVGPICYLVSAYCPGGNLGQWLHAQTQSVPFALAADWVTQMADGVQHAHGRGVLHRDLKPANILLHVAEDGVKPTNQDSSFVPRVTDFGLAKLLDTDSGLTRTGIVVGTPQYMAPEQMAGKNAVVGPGADVYGLGVILYELLTGRPPFVGETTLETVRQVRELEVTAPRQLRPTIPLDLETICLRCLQKEPGRRYGTAAQLADDLRRFSTGRPILARPVSAGEKALRWCRRHPLSAFLLAALMVSLFSGIVAVFWQWQRAERLAVQKGAESERATKSYERARAVVERLTLLGGEMADRPGMDRTREALYAELQTYYRELLEEDSSDPRLRIEAARAGRRLGQIRQSLGQYPAAEDAYRTALRRVEELLAERPGYPEARAELVDICKLRGDLLQRTSGRAAALVEFARARDTAAALSAEYPEQPYYHSLHANALLNWAGRKQFEDPAAAEAALHEAITINRRLLSDHPDDPFRRREYALAIDDLGFLHQLQRRYAPAEAAYVEALAIREALVQENPQAADRLSFLARSHMRMGSLRQDTAQWVKAEQSFRAALVPLGRLTTDYPDIREYHSTVVDVSNRLVAVLRTQDRAEDAVTELRRGLAEQQRLAALLPEAVEQRTRLIHQSSELAIGLNAVEQYAEAIPLMRSVLAASSKNIVIVNELAWALAVAPDKSLRSPQEAIDLAERATRAVATSGSYWNTLGAAQLAAGNAQTATVALEKASKLNQGKVADDWLLLTLAYAQLGNRDLAQECFTRADAIFHFSKPAAGATRRLRDEAAAALAER